MTWMAIWKIIPKRLLAEFLVVGTLIGVVGWQSVKIRHLEDRTTIVQQECDTRELQANLEAARKALEALEKQRQAQDQALKETQEKLAEITKKEAQANEKLRKALSDNTAWSESNVPDSVLDALRSQGAAR